MDNFKPFTADRKFYALDHFPYGLMRCGEFSNEQAQLLESHGICYEALDTGVIEPKDVEEQRFVEVCQGKKEPKTVHEKAWRRFCEKVQKPRIYQTSDISEGSRLRPRTDEETLGLDY